MSLLLLLRPVGETADVSVNAGLSSGSGASAQPLVLLAPAAAVATGAGAALNASVRISAAAAIASGTGSAASASISLAPRAGVAAGTGSAANATTLSRPSAAVSTGTGAAINVIPLIKPNAGLSSGAGAAHAPPIHVQSPAEVATGAGQAYDATVTTATATDADAEIAVGTGQANVATPLVAPNAELASAMGTALDATATQVLRPIADLSGNWHGEDARTTDLYTSVDDRPFDDGTYIESPNAPTSSDFHEFDLPSANDPVSSNGHVVRYRYGGEGTATLVVELRQGATVIASWQHVNPTSPALAEQTLTGPEADSITDYTDLRVRVRGAD